MPFATISIPAFLGVSRISQPQRLPVELDAAVNVDRVPHKGMDKRAGTSHVPGSGDVEEIVVADTGQTKYVIWINRSETERFVLFVDPDSSNQTNTVQAFNITTGAAVVVEALDSSGAEVALGSSDSDVAAMRGYLRAGSQTARQRYRAVQVEDATFILNREVSTALKGSAITYRSADAASAVRNQNYAQNVAVWRDFLQPPVNVDTYPADSVLEAGGNIDSNAIWYATDDDIGLPQGFWFATSTTQPPWFRRLPTEGANSLVDEATMPLRLQFDGTKFVLQFVNWTARYAGDSTTNPGPTFIGTALSDMTFHQGRFWFAAGERVVSSRAGDLFNLWINSTSLVTDADPIDEGIQGSRQSNALILEPFRESLVVLTDASRQVEIRANGPLTPQSVQFYDSSTVYNVPYVTPVQRGNQLYFAGERDFSMVVYEYDYDPQQVSNRAVDITRRVVGYIPAEAHWMTASQTHDQLFMLTLQDPDKVFVNRRESGPDGNTAFHSWYEWQFAVDEIISCNAFDDDLYFVMRRGALFYVERLPLGDPRQDIDGNPSQTLGYAVRCDRKVKIQGAYSTSNNETTWTIPYVDSSIDCVVLAPTWDTATVKSGGTIVPITSVRPQAEYTSVTAEGDWENNADGVNAPAFLGVGYTARVDLSEQFVRDQQQSSARGDTSLMRMTVRHRDSGGYTVIVTPAGRAPIRHTFTNVLLGNTPLDGVQLQGFGEFQCKVMSASRNCGIALVNDTPLPTAWVDAELTCEFLPMSYSPVR